MGKFNVLSQRPNYNTSSNDNQNVILIKLELLIVYIIEGIAVKDEEKTFLTDICCGNQMSKQEESVVRAV